MILRLLTLWMLLPFAESARNLNYSRYWLNPSSPYISTYAEATANASLAPELFDLNVTASQYETNFAIVYNATKQFKTNPMLEWLTSKQVYGFIKDSNRFIRYNMWLSPAMKASERRRNAALKHYALHQLAIPTIKAIGEGIWNFVDTMYLGYLRDQWQQIQDERTEREALKQLNFTKEPLNDTTYPVPQDGTLIIFNGHGARFQPFGNYTVQYYTVERDDIVEARPYKTKRDKYIALDTTVELPAIQYPWPWKDRLAMTRELLAAFMRLNASIAANLTSNTTSLSGSGFQDVEFPGPNLQDVRSNVQDLAFSGSNVRDPEFTGPTIQDLEPGNLKSGLWKRRLVRGPDAGDDGGGMDKSSSSSSKSSLSSSSSSGEEEVVLPPPPVMQNSTLLVLQAIQILGNEFHFASGIPRSPMAANETHDLFLSFEMLLYRHNNSLMMRLDQNRSFFATQEGLYKAMVHYYAFPSILITPNTNCSNLRRSSVTVYTPTLESLDLIQWLQKPMAQVHQERLNQVLEIVQIAFDAEMRALEAGLRGPSTVWYSMYDRHADELGDAILGYVNGSDPATKPLHVYEGLEANVIKHSLSYFTILDQQERFWWSKLQQKPLVVMEETSLRRVIAMVLDKTRALAQSIASYTAQRDAMALHQALVRNTTTQALYDAQTISRQSSLQFGFVQLGVNEQHVLYRDFRVPVPMHLVVRLVIRLVESQLLLVHEAVQVLGCLAMLELGLTYYRCTE